MTLIRTLPFLVVAALPAQAAWSRLYPTVSPSARIGAVMAGFEPTGQVVLFGGDGLTSPLGDTWVLTGNLWSPWNGAAPPARNGAAMVYDAARQRLVLFGGTSSGSSAMGDLWEWDGTGWLQRAAVPAPPPRRLHAMAFDRERGVTVLFGGLDNNPSVLSDLWEWNGASWALRTPTAGPLGRQQAAMAFDPVRRSVLLHGGMTTNTTQGIVNDTWSWDGSLWQQRLPFTPPPPRQGPKMETDLARGRVVLHGGIGLDASTWEWDGQQWGQMPVVTSGQRGSHTLAYDAATSRLIEFGGFVSVVFGYVWMDDTWVYATPHRARVTPYGSGCAGSNGTPTLAAAPYSLPWIGDVHRERVAGLAPGCAGVFWATGLSATPPIPLGPFGMPGCDQFVLPTVVEFGPANGGIAEWQLTIPNAPAFVGVRLVQQAFALDPAANALGLTASNGVELVTGRR